MLTQAINAQKQWEEVTYSIVLVLLMVFAVDALSGGLRRRLIRGEGRSVNAGQRSGGPFEPRTRGARRPSAWGAAFPASSGIPEVQRDGVADQGPLFVHPDCGITPDRTFHRFEKIGPGSRAAHSHSGDYSYCDRFADIASARIGRFFHIAAFARIGPTDHPMDKASLHHFHYRSGDYWDDAAHDEDWFAHRRARVCTIGHDTWIGPQAIVGPEITVGPGAVVAAGALVTEDVPPFCIIAGAPTRPLCAGSSPTAPRNI